MWKKISCWLLVLFWLMVIFTFSSMDGRESNDQSKTFIMEVSQNIVKLGQKMGIVKETVSTDQFENFTYRVNYLIRKLAHGTIYFVLAILVMFALTRNQEMTYNKYSCTEGDKCNISVMICLIYSLMDEFHQTFVPGRTGVLFDCVIDTIGSILGSVFIVLFWKIFHRKMKYKGESKWWKIMN